MPHSFGYRNRTRDLFKKKFRKHGALATQTYLKTFKLGDIVDVVADSAIQKGMPHKYYHGKTGIVWNVTPRAIGVEVNKKLGNRILAKRIHVRLEHVRHSKCRQEFLDRVQANDAKRAAAKKAGEQVYLKRVPPQPLKAETVKTSKTELLTVYPSPYAGLGW